MKSNQQDVLETCAQWLRAGHAVELVTVVRTWGSSPRPRGSIAAVREDGALVGSVSGGCVEKQLSEQFRTHDLPQLHTHTIDDEHAKRFGLACGGELQLLFETLSGVDSVDPILKRLSARERVKRTVDLSSQKITVESARREDEFSWNGEQLIQVFGANFRVLIIGAGELSRYTARFAMALDFEVIVVDPREHFHQAWSEVDVMLINDSPDDAVKRYAMDSQSAVLALSHDPNVDDLALVEALSGNAFYVGALGSKKTHEKRCHRLVGLDVNADALANMKAPIGLDIGGRTSAEIAVSIAAELIEVRSQWLYSRKPGPSASD